MALFYDDERQRDNEIIRFINEGLAKGQLCIYGTIHVTDKKYFKTMTSRITDYAENVRKGNLMVVDFVPFYIAALKQDLAPYKEVQKTLEKMLEYKKTKVRYVGDATGYLFKNGYFDECVMIESWWQNSRIDVVTTLCLFQKSLMIVSPFDKHKNKIFHTHDVVLNARSDLADRADNKPIQAAKLKQALMQLENFLGRAYAEELIEEFTRRFDIDLRSKTKSYSLHMIHEALDIMFGMDAADLLMDRLKREITS